MLRSLLVFLIFLIQVKSSSAQWQVKVDTDLMTDKETKTAYISNDSDHKFSLFRADDGRVFGNFRLSEGNSDQISHKRLPIFRIDKHKPSDMEGLKDIQHALRKMGTIFYQWEPKWVNFIVWHGKPEKEWGEESTIKRLMNGKKILFRYFLPTGGYKHTEFSLEGADKAISEAFNIPIKK